MNFNLIINQNGEQEYVLDTESNNLESPKVLPTIEEKVDALENAMEEVITMLFEVSENG